MKPRELFFQAGDERYSLQSNDGDYYKQNGTVDENVFNQHLQGIITMGAYTTYQNNCLFGVWDIDINKYFYSKHEDPIGAFKEYKDDIIHILKQFDEYLKDYPHYFEFSGRKGAHVWVFFEKPLPSEDVFDFLTTIEEKIYFRRQIFHIEKFPKQATTSGDGNLIKLPLAIHRVSGHRAYWCNPDLEQVDLKWEDIEKIKKLKESKKKQKYKGNKHVPKPGINGKVEFIKSTPEGLERLEKRCVALRNARPEGTTESNNWHIFVGAVFGRLNLTEKVHEAFRSNAFDYNEQTTSYHLSKLMSGMGNHHPIGCKFAVDNGFCNHPCRTVTPFDHLKDSYPMFVDDVQDKSSNFVSTSTNPPLFSLASASVNLNKQMADIYSADVVPQAQKAIKVYQDIFAMNDQSTAGNAIVLNTIPGGFKTTATVEMVVDALNEDKEFGAIIVVERNRDVIRIAEEINNSFGMFGPAYPFYGYDPENPQDCLLGHKSYKAGMCDKKNCSIPMTKCRVKMNHLIQYNYRVVVMSHQRLKMYGSEMKRFQNWHNSMSSKFRRTHLIIDEQPPLLELMRFDSDTLNNFLSVLPNLDNGVQYVQDYTQPVLDLIKNIDGRTNAREVIKPQEVPEFKFDARFENSWKDYTLDMASLNGLPVALESVYNYGGIYIKKNLGGLPEISTGYYLNNSWDFDRTIILDGTADISQRYKSTVFDKVYVPQLHTYEHLTFKYYNKFNLSRSTYEKKENLIPGLVSDIKEVIKKRNKVYVVVYKENMESYAKEFTPEIESGKVVLRTFGSTRGDNSMRDCDTIIFTGLIHKGELNYLSESLVLNQDYSMNLNAQKHRKSRKFKDRNTEIIKMSSWLEDFVQEVYRTRLRSHNLQQDVQAYLIVSDPDFLNLIEGYFEGCKMEEWEPKEISKARLTGIAEEIVEQVINRVKEGESKIPKNSLGLNSDTLKKTLNRNPEIEEILNDAGIEIHNKNFAKGTVSI
ncbi:MAG: hypothetical protein D8M58_17125 [Calditrichaeota bacterium]|nr:MAG: hypothetical protein DWQ03_12255 [Calditrichota bacterium]MBL1207130.1 hypothetical protein [Calditrichota bacterium]NOG46960.1 hypothetical protein [Calditrichota bacterium]